MACSQKNDRRRIVVDSIHGDIELTDLEWQVIDTGSFQRLRFIKQLGMGHLVYPNATHTRFAHSIGALGTMARILTTAKRNGLDLNPEQEQNLRLAALLHDVGHYPYSHLMEGVDNVKLAEGFIHKPKRPKQTLAAGSLYPKHEKLGQLVVTNQKDLLDAIGGLERAKRVAAIFTRTAAETPQWCKLVSSSLDMDRIDYLLRDTKATGVPYGSIDINYLLNSLRVSQNGLVGVDGKALPAAEQYLFARYFMHRTVYWHKTTYAFEEATRQLLRRIRDLGLEKYKLPKDASDVERRMKDPEGLRTFTDAFLDNVIGMAVRDDNEDVRTIAKSLLDRRPPKLLHEVCDLQEKGRVGTTATKFKMACKHQLQEISNTNSIPLWRFMYCESAPLRFEKRSHELAIEDARVAPPEDADELIKVFCDGDSEPKSLVDIEHSIIRPCSNYTMQLFRLYVIDDGQTDSEVYNKLKGIIRRWNTD